MLHFITWPVFIRTLFILAALYYPVILTLYYSKEVKDFLKKIWTIATRSSPHSGKKET